MIEFLWNNFFKPKNQSKIDFLKGQPLFSSLNNKEIRIVEKFIHHRTYFSGEVIFKPGSSIGLYMVMKGQVQITYGEDTSSNTMNVSQLEEGDFFGELALVQDKGYHKTTATATEPSELLGFFKPELLSLIETSPRLSARILMKLSSILGLRLQKAGESLMELHSKKDKS